MASKYNKGAYYKGPNDTLLILSVERSVHGNTSKIQALFNGNAVRYRSAGLTALLKARQMERVIVPHKPEAT